MVHPWRHVDRHPRKSAIPHISEDFLAIEESPDAATKKPLVSRRRMLLVAPAALAVAGALKGKALAIVGRADGTFNLDPPLILLVCGAAGC
jgi:hypothetical protein